MKRELRTNAEILLVCRALDIGAKMNHTLNRYLPAANLNYVHPQICFYSVERVLEVKPRASSHPPNQEKQVQRARNRLQNESNSRKIGIRTMEEGSDRMHK